MLIRGMIGAHRREPGQDPKHSSWEDVRRQASAVLFAGGLIVCAFTIYQPPHPASSLTLAGASISDSSSGASSSGASSSGASSSGATSSGSSDNSSSGASSSGASSSGASGSSGSSGD